MSEEFARSVTSAHRIPLETDSRASTLAGGLRFLLPFILTVLAYDLQRFYLPYARGEIHVESIYRLELMLFGISRGGELLTPNEWIMAYIHPMLDLVCGLAYLMFIPQFLAVALYFRFALPRFRGGQYAASIRILAERMAWAFLVVNLLGYATYVIVPAAPPWFVSDYGFAAPSLDTPPSAAGAARFDALLGVTVFEQMYSKSANVFGAVPSLHAAYPVTAAYFAWRLRSLRVFCLGFAGVISFAAVYLNHHYVLDVILGWLYGALAAVLFARKRSSAA